MNRGEREVRADIDVAAHRIGRAVWTARLATVIVGAVAIGYAFDEQSSWEVAGVVAGGLLIVVLSEWMKRGSQLAAGAVLASYVGAVTTAYVMLGRPTGLLAALVVAYRLFDGLRGAIDLAELRVEFAQVYKPREPQAGDVYSIRQNTTFGAAKLLALEPGRVHIRLLRGRSDDRESARTISSSVAEYEHLPMDLAAFLAWEPELLRAEPLLPEELHGYNSWLRVQGAAR
ncbi:MAG: hypothetical protein JF589_12110 [Gemmatimonadetes bacterium]|nr:hypothetical protein [Gemmatimonadota bacterium]